MEKQTCCCTLKKEAKSRIIFEEGDLYYCGDIECKERITKEVRENQERAMYQGRTFKQYQTSATILYYTFLSLIGFILGYFIFTLVASL